MVLEDRQGKRWQEEKPHWVYNYNDSENGDKMAVRLEKIGLKSQSGSLGRLGTTRMNTIS